jgi:hypothetical protein
VPTLAADELLAAMDARLESCVTEVVIAGHPTPAEREVLRAIRSRAAVVTLQCIGLMLRCACAVLPSTLMRVHVGALRPRELGDDNSAVDAVVPVICRMYAKSLPLRIAVPLLWVLGVTCHYLVLFDRFENGSANQWLACAGGTLMLPVVVCAGGSLNAKTVRQLLEEFEMWFVIVYVLGMMSLLVFLFREQQEFRRGASNAGLAPRRVPRRMRRRQSIA